jgi:hypothetical protein
MSDRPQGTVRTEAQVADGAAAGASPAGTQFPGPARPVSATQSIPTTGGIRAQGQATPDTAPGAGAPANPFPAPPPGAARPGQPGSATATAAAGAAPAAAARTGGRPVRGKGGKAGRGPRRARLQLRHIDTWSAFKISLVLSIALFFIWMVAIGILYAVLSALGVFNTLNDLFGQLGSASSGNNSSGNVITPGIVLGGAAVIGAINIILMTALCTVATFIYNMCADLVGGLEVTLSERD